MHSLCTCKSHPRHICMGFQFRVLSFGLTAYMDSTFIKDNISKYWSVEILGHRPPCSKRWNTPGVKPKSDNWTSKVPECPQCWYRSVPIDTGQPYRERERCMHLTTVERRCLTVERRWRCRRGDEEAETQRDQKRLKVNHVCQYRAIGLLPSTILVRLPCHQPPQ